tara:strand:- start:1959 stop:2588 length:630 start_codon:yes stop_codon:yes gene_type:complete
MVNPNINDKPDFYNDLDKIIDAVWDLLLIGKNKSKSEFHQGYISTYSNNYPSIRTVVLRHVNKSKNTISFHTDIRSKKIEELKDNGKISMLFYDHGKKIQLKISGNAIINNNNEQSRQAWDQSRSFSKKCYIVEKPPGTKSDNAVSGYADEHEHELPSNDILEKGFNNFTLVDIHIASIEWLYLHRDGHRRAFFTFDSNTLINKTWLTP